MKYKKIYVIVESAGKISNIQKYLGDKYTVVASNGQIVELAKGGRYGIGVNPINNFQTYYNLLPDKISFLNDIINNYNSIEQIIIATDVDTEGDGIAWHIAQSLKHLNKPMHRAAFHEITKSGIEEGLKNISPISENKFKSQETRRIVDRLVGFMASPFLINYYGNNLSAGRVQSVATRLVIEREREVSAFKPQEYWNLTVNLIKGEQGVFAKCQSKIKTKEEAEKYQVLLALPSIKDSVFQVSSVNKKEKKEQPDPPLTTAKMQQLMSTKYGIDGELTMQIAQNLYELGLVTYIRTDSVRISDAAINNVRVYLTDNKLDIPSKPNIFKNKGAAQDAHECIRPTAISSVPKNINLGQNTQLLYKLIWEQFVSSQMCPAVYDTLDVQIIHPSSQLKFKVSGKTLRVAGYLSLSENKIKIDDILPNLNKDDTLHLIDNKSIVIEQKFTQPPSRYNYSSLLKDLENKGIGRPSTFVEIISKITHRNYVDKQGNTYHGTKLGDDITSILTKYFDFMDYGYTSELEKQMDEVALGNIESSEVLHKFYDIFKDKLKQAHLQHNGKVCDKCGAPMYLKSGKNDVKFWGCSLYPFCMSVSNFIVKENLPISCVV